MVKWEKKEEEEKKITKEPIQTQGTLLCITER